jgi:hypothetical protein
MKRHRRASIPLLAMVCAEFYISLCEIKIYLNHFLNIDFIPFFFNLSREAYWLAICQWNLLIDISYLKFATPKHLLLLS